jgi:hypothetical protein
MPVPFKGVNRIMKRLADGSSATYYFAWKGCLRPPGKSDDPEFIAPLNEAAAKETHQPSGTLQVVLNAYPFSRKFRDLSPRTRKDLVRQARQIEVRFGGFPLPTCPPFYPT